MLDLDALGAADGIKWVWGGTALLDEGPDVRKDRVMIRLSRGGSDATVAREFDLDTKQFISPEQGGFELPEAKSRFSYKASAVYRAVHGECRTLGLHGVSHGATHGASDGASPPGPRHAAGGRRLRRG